MEQQIKLYQGAIHSQLHLRNYLQIEHSTNPHIKNAIPRLLDIIDEQIHLLNTLITDLKAMDK